MRPFLVAAFLLASSVSLAQAAETFPQVVTGMADFTEGDLTKSRDEGRADALEKALLKALKEEVGQAVLDDAGVLVRTKFLNNVGQFFKGFGVLATREDGFRLFVTVGYELDREKLRKRIEATNLARGEGRTRVALVWALEEPQEPGSEELPTAATAAAVGKPVRYLAAEWMDDVTAPPTLGRLREALLSNGYAIAAMSVDDRAWITGELKEGAVNRVFLRDLGMRLKVDYVVFVRVVKRALALPPAARHAVARLHHVAFVLEPKSGQPVSEPVSAPMIDVADMARLGADEVTDQWRHGVLDLLEREERATLKLVVRGVESPGAFEGIWQQLKAGQKLSDTVPRRISANEVEFGVPGLRSLTELESTVRGIFPQAVVERETDKVIVSLPLGKD